MQESRQRGQPDWHYQERYHEVPQVRRDERAQETGRGGQSARLAIRGERHVPLERTHGYQISQPAQLEEQQHREAGVVCVCWLLPAGLPSMSHL